jgi:hypothetical protein
MVLRRHWPLDVSAHYLFIHTMKVTEIEKNKRYTIRRESSREKWPEDWAKACGLPGPRLPETLKFHDGDFIADTVDIVFEPAQAEPPKREMVVKWANSLPNRMAILKFWEWMQKESASFREDSNGYDIEKLLDRYHEIDRIKLDDERRAMLEPR